MPRPPPRSTLFPYTTLFRSQRRDRRRLLALNRDVVPTVPRGTVIVAAEREGDDEKTWRVERSEEHTSELQSLRHLVCRLLLEKKKKKNTTDSRMTRSTDRRD